MSPGDAARAWGRLPARGDDAEPVGHALTGSADVDRRSRATWAA
jgi:hypothetical protein